jgi:hypothetical protein
VAVSHDRTLQGLLRGDRPLCLDIAPESGIKSYLP